MTDASRMQPDASGGSVTRRSTNCAARCAEADRFFDGQGLDRQADRAVGMLDHRALDADVGDDLAGNGELRLAELVGQQSATAAAPGPGTRRSMRWRSPAKVSECQSVERKSLSKILLRSTPARCQQGPQQARGGRRHGQFHHRAPSRNGGSASTVRGRGSRPLRKIEHESRIAHHLAPEPGRRHIA